MARHVMPCGRDGPVNRKRELSLALAAGHFNGEGTIVANVRMNRRSGMDRHIIMAVYQTAVTGVPWMIVQMMEALGVGNFYSVKRRQPRIQGRTEWVWQLGRLEIQTAISLLWPWLSPDKRAQAERAFQMYSAVVK